MKRSGRDGSFEAVKEQPNVRPQTHPRHPHAPFPFWQIERERCPPLDLGLNTDNGPPERRQSARLELGESKSGVSNGFRKIFLCLNDQMLVRLAVVRVGNGTPFLE